MRLRANFSDIINRLVARKPNFSKYAGAIPELPSEEVKREIRKWRAEYVIGIDSDFIIDLLRGNQEAEEKAKEIQDPAFTTTINFFEVMRGVIRHSKKKEIAIEFFNEIQILDLDYPASLKSAEIASKLDQKGIFVGSGDVLIAGILLSNGIEKIISNNKEPFEACGLNVLSYENQAQ